MIAKKRLLPILVAVLMVFAMMPMTAGTVFAESDTDTVPPVINPESLHVTLPEGKDKVTVGDTVTFAVDVTDDRYVSRVQIHLQYPVSNKLEELKLTYAGTDEEGRNGTWTGEFTITDETECGIWQIKTIYAYDTQNGAALYNNNLWSSGTDLSAYDFEVTAPDCPLDLTTPGYSMMLDGEEADTTFGGNYYVDTADQAATPIVKVRFDAEDGTWTTLAPRKYTLKFEKKTGENSWEDYTADTFSVDENGTATYRVSAIGKESLYYTGTVGPVEFKVIKKNTVTFVSSHDNSVIETVKVNPGRTVEAIEAPVIYDSGEGGDGKPFIFYGWGTDPEPAKYTMAQASLYDFSTPINEDITLYAIYRTSISFIATEGGSVSSGVWGGSYGSETQNGIYLGDQTNTVPAYAKTNEGYHFMAWRIGNAQGEDVSGQGINCHEGIDWNEDTVNTIFVPSDHNYTFYAVFGHKVTFDTRSGSEIAPQYVIPGEKAARPDDPIKGGGAWQGGGDFVDWYADKALTQRFNFNTPITEDTTVYAKWAYGFSISSYDKTNSADYAGGQYMVLQHGVTEDDMYYGGSNYTLCEGDAITLKVYPDKGYKFAGWYKGEYIGMVDDEHTQVSRPLDMSNPDNLLSVDLEYSFTVDQSTVICPVFEACTEHQWEQKIQKATPTADGRIYQKCSICGTEEIVAPLLKVSNISLEGTSFTYTGKAIKPKVTVANASEALAADQFTVAYSKNTNVGTATVKVTLKGDYYEGTKSLTFKINKAANPLTIKPKTATVKYSKLKKKTQTLAVTKVIKFTKQLKDKKTYTLSSAKKGKKSFKKYFKVNKTTGKVTIKKNSKMKKGTYKVKVKVQATGNANYKESAVKTVTFKVRVK